MIGVQHLTVDAQNLMRYRSRYGEELFQSIHASTAISRYMVMVSGDGGKGCTGSCTFSPEAGQTRDTVKRHIVVSTADNRIQG